MNIIDLNTTNNNTAELSFLPETRYENIFKVGKNNNYLFYNIIKTVKFPDNLDVSLYYEKTINQRKPYTAISFDSYGTQDLWWLILLANKITNPVSVITPGTRLKIIKQKFIQNIIKTIINLNNA